MKRDGLRNWKEKKIWESLLDKDLIVPHILNPGLLEWWEDKVGIRKEDYVKMNDAKFDIILDDFDKYDIISHASKHIENLEDILKCSNINPMKKKVAKILRDKLKIKLINKKHDAAGWAIITKAIEEGDIDPENYD